MRAREALVRARKALADSGIEDAVLESELLLRDVLNVSRVELYADLDREITAGQDESFRQVLDRRLRHEPLTYITRHCEFYGRDFYIDRRVLIPRPETELIVVEALKWAAQRGEPSCVIADIGAGSGIIAVTLALHLPRARIYASDVSPEALEVAAINCLRHGVENRISLLHGNLLDAVPEPVDMVVANLPYVRTDEMANLSHEIRLFEPVLALDGGVDGLDEIRRLGAQLDGRLRPGGCVLLEIGMGQAEGVTGFLGGLYPSAVVTLIPDWNGIERVVRMSVPERARIISPSPCQGGSKG